MLDHDRLFKELLAVFFLDFVELFAPEELALEIEPDSLGLRDKETFPDLGSGDRHIVDLLARVRLRASGTGLAGAYVLIHVETQAQPEREFAQRMHRYFAGLSLRHALRVYPIAVFSFERPLRPQPARFDVRLPGLHVLAFRFRAVQLNRMDWRMFLRRPNPVAAALMARMRIAPRERRRVKAECLRLLATLRLDPDRTRLVSASWTPTCAWPGRSTKSSKAGEGTNAALAAMSGEIFPPPRWTPREAFRLLTDIPQLEVAGVVVRVPAKTGHVIQSTGS